MRGVERLTHHGPEQSNTETSNHLFSYKFGNERAGKRMSAADGANE